MASIEKRTRSDRVRYYVRYRDPAGRQVVKVFDRKAEADRHLIGVESAKLTGAYVDPRRASITLGDWAAQWLATQSHLKPSTRARYEGIVGKQVLPRWRTVKLGNISHVEVAGWINDLQLAPATVRYVHRVFSLMLDLAVRDGRIVKNPASGVKLPKAAPVGKRYLTHRQVADLASACGDHGLVIRVLAYCGLRWSELAALRVERVDLLRRRIEIAEAVTEVRGSLEWGTPKTNQRRSVPLPRALVDELAAHLAGKAPGDLVFVGGRGGVLRNLNWRRDVFDSAAASVGLPGLTPHELRHTAASLAVSAGANVKAVQKMLGVLCREIRGMQIIRSRQYPAGVRWLVRILDHANTTTAVD